MGKNQLQEMQKRIKSYEDEIEKYSKEAAAVRSSLYIQNQEYHQLQRQKNALYVVIDELSDSLTLYLPNGDKNHYEKI